MLCLANFPTFQTLFTLLSFSLAIDTFQIRRRAGAMYTDRFSHYDSGKNSLYPPPLKPLPPLPTTTCFLLTDSPPFGLLLSHPVPSPSLRFDVMTLPLEKESCASSMHTDLDQFSYPTSRDSSSSIIEFAQSLLPPTPISTRPFTPSNSVDCRLQTLSTELSPASQSTNQSFYSVSDGGRTSYQIRKLCSELEHLQTNRRDSAMFDVTSSKPSTVRRVAPEIISANKNMQVPDLVDPRSSGSHQHIADLYYQPVRSAKPLEPQVSSVAETSFIDWDEEEPRFAKMKKSIADLRSVSRSRSNSAPLDASRCSSTTSESNKDNVTKIIVDHVESAVQPKQKEINCKPPAIPPKNRKSRQHRRRTIFIPDYTQKSRQSIYQSNSLPVKKPSTSSIQRKRISTASTAKSVTQKGGLRKLTCWIRKVVNCS